MPLSLNDWLTLIELHGSVRKAAITQNISPQAVSERFLKLDNSNSLKIRYLQLTNQSKNQGRPKIYPDYKTANRLRQQRYRNNHST